MRPLVVKMNLQQVTFPSTTIITLAEAKAQCRVTSTDEDALIMDCIRAATSLVETRIDTYLQSSTFVAYFDNADDDLWIWKYPITSLDSVKYIDTNGSEQTLSAANYSSDITDSPARIKVTTHPSVKRDIFNAYRAYFTAGFTNREKIPQEIIQWIKILTADFYQSRQSGYTGQISEVAYNQLVALDKFRKGQI